MIKQTFKVMLSASENHQKKKKKIHFGCNGNMLVPAASLLCLYSVNFILSCID